MVAATASPVDDKRAQAQQIASDLDRQAGRIRLLDANYRRAQSQLATYEDALDQAKANLDAAERQQAEARARVVRHAQDAYTLGGSLFVLSDLWRSKGGDDLVARRFYIEVVNGLERGAIDDLRARRQDLDARRAELEAAEQVTRSRAAQMAADKRSLEAAFAAQDANLSRVKGELATLVAAEQAARDAASRRLVAASAAPSAPSAPAPEGDIWDCIKELESGNNYASPGGGAYQFTDETWHGLGQTGTAGDASPALQDAMAQQLYSERGYQPWTTAPRCGRPT